jgi:hypothetical protein
VFKINPSVFSFVQTASGNQNMEMWMKIQPATEGVRYNEDQWHHAITCMHPASDDGSTESSDIA